jgi:hypothetical protein
MKLFHVLPLLSFLFIGCSSTTVADAPSGAASVSDANESKIDEVERKLKLAHARLEVKEMEQEAFVHEHGNNVRYAQADLAMAQAKLAKFREVDAPGRVASEKLNLRTAMDRAQEAKDELAQIEIMYKDQDLDDLTAEFVVSRGRRSAERAQARIEIQEAAFNSLKERELPQEEKQLELAVDKAVTGLEKIEIDGKISEQGKAIATQEARDGLNKLEQELSEAKQGAQS